MKLKHKDKDILHGWGFYTSFYWVNIIKFSSESKPSKQDEQRDNNFMRYLNSFHPARLSCTPSKVVWWKSCYQIAWDDENPTTNAMQHVRTIFYFFFQIERAWQTNREIEYWLGMSLLQNVTNTICNVLLILEP